MSKKKYRKQPECPLKCFCHTREALEFNRGNNIPAFNCCEHCCPMWRLHNKKTKINKVLKLSMEDSIQFIKALRNPQKPNKALIKAFKDYKRTVESDV